MTTGTPVASILPGEGVELEGGERINAPVVVSNADPRTILRLLGKSADPAWRAQVESVPIEGCSMKVSVALSELPNFKARPGTHESHHYGQINTPLTKQEWQQAYDTAAPAACLTGCGPSCTSRPCLTKPYRLPARIS